jgi:hypothetical protein
MINSDQQLIWEAYAKQVNKRHTLNEAYGNSIDPEDGLTHTDHVRSDIESEIKDTIESTSESLAENGVYGEPNYDAAIRILMTKGDAELAAIEALAGHTMSSGASPYDSMQVDFEAYIADLADDLDYIVNGKQG